MGFAAALMPLPSVACNKPQAYATSTLATLYLVYCLISGSNSACVCGGFRISAITRSTYHSAPLNKLWSAVFCIKRQNHTRRFDIPASLETIRHLIHANSLFSRLSLF